MGTFGLQKHFNVIESSFFFLQELRTEQFYGYFLKLNDMNVATLVKHK